MSEFELNVRYKLDMTGIDTNDSHLATLQYSFLPDAFNGKAAKLTMSGDNAVMTICREERSEEADVLLRGNVTAASTDSALIFDPKTKVFRFVNSRISIQGLKRDREEKFSDAGGLVVTSRVDVSKRLKAAAASKKKKTVAATAAAANVIVATDQHNTTAESLIAAAVIQDSSGLSTPLIE
jgi:hypothetical protein